MPLNEVQQALTSVIFRHTNRFSYLLTYMCSADTDFRFGHKARACVVIIYNDGFVINVSNDILLALSHLRTSLMPSKEYAADYGYCH